MIRDCPRVLVNLSAGNPMTLIRAAKLSAAVGFLLMAVTASPALAQNPHRVTIHLYSVDVTESMVRSPTEAPQTCTARERDPVRIVVDTTVVPRQQDSVTVRVVRVEGASRTRIKPPVDLDVYAGARRRAFVTTMDSVVLTTAPGGLAGQRVTVQEPNTGRVFCSITLAGPGPTTRPPGRLLPEPEAVVSIGASFDLLDGLRANDLYSDARVFAPGLWNIETGLFTGWRIGMQAGIYQGRVSSKGSVTGDTASRRFTYQIPVVPLDTAGGLLVRHRTYERTETRRENTLGMYTGVNVAIARDLYIVPLLVEVRREDFRHSIRDTLISDTTIRLRPNEPIRGSTVPYSSRVTSGVRYAPAFMTGVRLDMRRETFNLVLQPLAGVTLATACPRPTADVVPRCSREWMGTQWDVTFELEAAKSGIKLGGEVRGFQSGTPDILVFLAKEFSIEKFADFLTGTKR
jgi:hypothetical protein